MKPNLYICDATLRRLGGDRELLLELIHYFLEDAPALLELVRFDLENGDREKVHRAAHNLRSLLANFDAKEATASALALELAAKRGELAEIAAALPRFEQEIDALISSLQAFLSTVPLTTPAN
jgi:HPt (histidine-containing phosphotransfer) domain-containing protein